MFTFSSKIKRGFESAGLYPDILGKQPEPLVPKAPMDVSQLAFDKEAPHSPYSVDKAAAIEMSSVADLYELRKAFLKRYPEETDFATESQAIINGHSG